MYHFQPRLLISSYCVGFGVQFTQCVFFFRDGGMEDQIADVNFFEPVHSTRRRGFYLGLRWHG